MNGELIEIIFGRVLFNEILLEIDRNYYKIYGKKEIKFLIKFLYEVYGFIEIVEFINRVKNFGYYYGIFVGVLVGIEDLEVLFKKKFLLN